MEAGRKREGRYLSPADRERPAWERRQRRVSIWRRMGNLAALILGDGLLIYMIAHGLIDQMFGALFVAALSVFLTYQLHY